MTTILVLDDSMTVRMDLTEALEGAGMRVIGAGTIDEARIALDTEHVALAIFDVNLPDGDSLDLVGWMRSTVRFAELPVLMLSSEAEVKDRVRGLRSGATDYVGKPYDTDSVIARVKQLTDRSTVSQRTTILVIDDSTTVRMMLAQGLEDAGFRVLRARSGAEGLLVAARERPTAIVCDGVMPGMDGATFIRRIRLDAALRTTPCLLITGSDEGVGEVDALEAGADAFVRKDSDIEVVLARIAAMLRTAGETPPPSASLLAPKRILAIDDEPDFLAQLGEILADGGYDVVRAGSGDEALELLSVQQVDCIMLDWRLPGLSAHDVCQRIKAAPSVRDTPLIVISGGDPRSTMLEALGAGADDFISKTSGTDVLAARVRAQLRRRQIDDEQRRVRDRLVRSELTDQLERANEKLVATNEELEAFSYSVSHDLRAPLRAIGSFTSAVLEDRSENLDGESREYLHRVVRAAKNMGEMIEALLELSRINRVSLQRESVDITAKATGLLDELQQREPSRAVEITIAPNLVTNADRRLVRVVFDNLLSNAWKFTRATFPAKIEVGSTVRDGLTVHFVRDNGAGFDMAHAATLFRTFQRLHSEKAFPGTGIGLATSRRIVERHGGKIWAEAAVGEGATFYVSFTPS